MYPLAGYPCQPCNARVDQKKEIRDGGYLPVHGCHGVGGFDGTPDGNWLGTRVEAALLRNTHADMHVEMCVDILDMYVWDLHTLTPD